MTVNNHSIGLVPAGEFAPVILVSHRLPSEDAHRFHDFSFIARFLTLHYITTLTAACWSQLTSNFFTSFTATHEFRSSSKHGLFHDAADATWFARYAAQMHGLPITFSLSPIFLPPVYFTVLVLSFGSFDNDAMIMEALKISFYKMPATCGLTVT
jgi:hypothetical protein